jgi:hypothetical protein
MKNERTFWGSHMKKVLLRIVVIVVAFVIYANLFPVPDDSTNQKAAIEIIKKSYIPSAQLLSWNPDFAEAQWAAVQYPESLCAYKDCYKVTVWVDVIPNGEKKTIKAEWLAYAGNTKYRADNTEARTLFVAH